ncbi:hypothetical protein QR680_012640 [Steinernema hermaphroditum]|uniref:Reverse transcriptase domain-containing protein n=2 Tax=Steinernema hermaphroditum TaxID=289476 RepID=A0AA39M132_9BILA|nr:hypothetical protein QR680_012640 [Steinernema hermaphroditum]
MSSKLKGSRLEAEVDRYRSECNWRRMADVLGWVRSKNSGMEQFADLLEGELILEAFIESQSELLTPNPEHFDALRKAESLLQTSLETNSESAVISMDARLLLAKLYYFVANFREALANIEKSKLDKAGTPFETLRALKLVAEAYAIKGFSMEQLNAKEERRAQQEKNRIQVLYCFEKSAELAICYVSELEKSLNSATRSAAAPGTSALNADKIGELLETTLERVPLLTLRRNVCDKRWDANGVEWYRKIMTSLGDKAIGERLQQRLSRQLAEVLIRGMLESDYDQSSLNKSLSVTEKSQSLGFYTGSHKGYFSPVSRIEEILLLLLISEVLSTRDVILSRSDDLQSCRRDSIQDATMVHNLLTMVLSSLRQYQLLANIYERAMKFANQDRYIWFQFGMSLMCQGRWLRASRILHQCVTLEREDENECVEHMLLAKMEIEQLGQYDKAIEHADKAIKLCSQNWLKGRCMLLHAVAFSLKAQTVVVFDDRKQMLADAVCLFEAVIKHDTHDELAYFFCALQYAIARDMDTALAYCQRSLELNPEQPLAIMFLALLFTARNDYKGARELVIKALDDFPTHYGLLVLRLKLETKYGRVEEALNTSKHLLNFWRRLPRGSVDMINGEEENVSNGGGPPSKNGASDSVKDITASRSFVANQEVMAPVAPMFTTPLGIISKASHVSLHASVPDIPRPLSTPRKRTFPSLAEDRPSRNPWDCIPHQASIWVELAELFLEAKKVDDVQACVEEACSLFPNSHQALYLKGRLFSIKSDDIREKDPSSAASYRARAKSCLLSALAICPSHIPSLRHLAHVYRNDSNLKMAEKILRDVIRVDPLNNESWQALAEVLGEDCRYEESIEFSVSSGIPQGSVLGPLLFLLFINDITSIVSDLHVSIKLYADDVKLYSIYPVNNPNDELQIALDRLSTWSRTAGLKISVSKCFCLHIGRRNAKRAYSINGDVIPTTKAVRDLGLQMDPKLNFSAHVDSIILSAHRKCYLLMKTLRSTSLRVYVTAYKSYIRPILEYATECWNSCTGGLSLRVERAQKHFTRWICRRCRLPYASYADRLRHLEMETLSHRRRLADLIMVYKIVHGHARIPVTDFFSRNQRRSRNHGYTLTKPAARSIESRFFSSRVINDWNALPASIVNSATPKLFRSRIRNHVFPDGRR